MDVLQQFSSPEALAVLRERARVLALQDELIADDVGEPTLSFTLGDEHFSLPAVTVRETQRLGVVTPLPAVPAAIVGLVNVRGRLITCIDIRPLLDLPATPHRPDSMLLIVVGAGIELGLLVDQVTEVTARTVTIDPTPAANAGRGVAWVRGVDADLKLHLDPDVLLRDPRLIVNDTIDPAAAI